MIKNTLTELKKENTPQKREGNEFTVAGKRKSKFRCDVEKYKDVYQQISA